MQATKPGLTRQPNRVDRTVFENVGENPIIQASAASDQLQKFPSFAGRKRRLVEYWEHKRSGGGSGSGHNLNRYLAGDEWDWRR